MMLTRAAGRRLRRDATRTRTPTTLTGQLTLPRPWAAQPRHASTFPPSIASDSQQPRQQRRRSLASRSESRRLATTAELQPSPSSFSAFPQAAWARSSQQADFAQLPAWDYMTPLVVRDSVSAAPSMRDHHGFGGNPLELHQNLYACLRIGRLERASVILERLTSVYNKSVAEVTDAHNVYLQAMLEAALEDPQHDSMAALERWFHTRIIAQGVTPNAQTYVSLVRAAMNFIDGGERDAKVRELLDAAQQLGDDAVDAINSSPDFTDQEWDALLRLQPDAYEEPPTLEDVAHLNTSSPSALEKLHYHGLASAQPVSPIKPVPQKGLGLTSLKSALGVFEHVNSVPYPHDMKGTQEEKDYAYDYARQMRMEQDSIQAAVDRWKAEDKNMQDMGIHGVLNSKPVQAIMYNWYQALEPLFKQRIAHAKKVLAASSKDYVRDEAASYGPFLVQCKPEQLAAMTVARAINSCMRGHKEDSAAMKISALSISLGTDVQDTLNADSKARRAAVIKKQRKETRKALIEQLSKTTAPPTGSTPSQSVLTMTKPDFTKCDIPLSSRTKLGAMCLELLLQSATITATAQDPKTGETLSSNVAAFHHQVGFHQGKKIGYMVPHHDLMKKLRNDSVHSIATVKLPMVVEPKKWTTFEDGGYFTTPQKVVRQKNNDQAQKAYAQSAIENGDMSKVLSGLDVLGKVPWQINTSVLEVMAEAWNNGDSVGGLISEETGLQRPPEPPVDAGFRERAEWSKKLQAYENTKMGLHSQRCFQNFQLETARAFSQEKHIYFPHSVDFRGRAYPIPPMLNHIGSDLARGLLKFARAKELGATGLQWLKVHLANLYGFDKASLREREQFAVDQMDEIRDSATNPLNGRRWWTGAEDPWQCLACCIELTKAWDLPDPTRYMSQLPVHQDGTCNGLQHYAALGGDHAGARQVNLEPSDRPQDIYTGVAELVKEEVSTEAAAGKPLATFIDGYITRKVVKRTVMTNVYGVTFMGAKAQVADELKNIFPNFEPTTKVHSLNSVAMYVAVKIFSALGKIFNGAQEIQYWLGECGERITTSVSPEQIQRLKARYAGDNSVYYDPRYKVPKKFNDAAKKKLTKGMETFKTGIIWTTPLKMPIVQPYRKESTQIIRTKVQDITVQKRTPEDEVDKRKQLQAFPPNFIHSLDATHMVLSALKCNEMGLDFAAVHDSFWTHASDIPNLNVILRDAFVRMHSENIIDRLAAEFATRYSGHVYRANLHANAEVAQKITAWRSEWRKANGKTLKTSDLRVGSATYEEIALEAQRLDLLNSKDPAEREKGVKMVTPTSIWLANQDPKAFASFRLALLGETKNKNSATRTEEVRDKVRTAEAEAIVHDADSVPSTADVAYTLEEAQEEAELIADTEDDAPIATRKATAAAAQVQVWIPLTFPPVPAKGTWDVSRLRESQYFFS